MRTRVLTIPLFVSIAIALVEAKATSNAPRGVAPSKTKAYTADDDGKWTCLDGSKTIKFSAINDDYCDCPDGSDEPGTSACGTGYFFCANKGHSAEYIKTSRVNDGVCDPECCDGSDETDGQIQCPNTCEQVGAAAKKERERIRLIEEEGSKIRQRYIDFGKNAKRKLQSQLDKFKTQSATIKERASITKDALDKANAALQEKLESSKAEREAARKVQLAPLIEQQNARLAHAKFIYRRLHETLEDLKENANKNYHDMVVKSTIAGFDEHVTDADKEAANLPPVDTNKILTADQIMLAAVDETYDVRKDIGALFVLLKALKEGYNTDNNDEAVLRAVKVFDEFTPTWQGDHNDFVGEEPLEIPPEPKDHLNDAPQRKSGTWASLIEKVQKGAKAVGLGFLVPETRSAGAKRYKETDISLFSIVAKEVAQEAYDKASAEERRLDKEVEELERKLNMDYGSDERFAQLVDQCFEFKDVEYIYSVCLFGKAFQKSSSDTSLGTFSEWIGDNYDTQLYSGGMKCWNGPERSVKLIMSCGIENEIISVTEPEKCEYHFQFRTPAACRLLDDSETIDDNLEPSLPGEPLKKHDEL
ncbi:hypothetical protein BGZ94_000172 [Podila epigama]|nr:hypothetical protein BGZ94_000172 [Podila epigama]